MKSILITGGAGLVGSVLTKGLKDKFNIRILDIKKVNGVDSYNGDISNIAVSYTHLRANDTRP